MRVIVSPWADDLSLRAQQEVECRSQKASKVQHSEHNSEWRQATHADIVLRRSLAAKLPRTVGYATLEG